MDKTMFIMNCVYGMKGLLYERGRDLFYEPRLFKKFVDYMNKQYFLHSIHIW